MNDNGWIKIYRKILDWEWYGDPVVKCVFLDLLLRANHKDHQWKGVTVKKGTVITGREIMAQRLGFSEMQIRTAMSKLKSTNEITIKTTNKYSVVTINKYESYQQDNQPISQRITNKQPTNNQQITTNKNDKNEKKEIYTAEIREVTTYFNDIHRMSYPVIDSPSWANNYGYWRKTYTLEQIKRAILLWKKKGYIWKDGLGKPVNPEFEVLFRQRDKSDNTVDRIASLLSQEKRSFI